MSAVFRGIFRSSPLGVDLGSSAVKVVGLSGKRVTLAAIRDIAPAERAEEQVLSARLRDFFQEIKVQGREAAVCIPGSLTFVRTIGFPLMPDSELREAVRWEAKRQIPYAEEDALLDYVSSRSPEGIAVVFAAAEKKNVERHLSIFRDTGIKVIAADILPLALIRAMNPAELGTTIIIDIGMRFMEISVVRAGVLRLTRTVEMGAELIVNHLIGTGMGHEVAAKAIASHAVEEMTEPINILLREIMRSIDYYKATFKDRTFAAALLTGGLMLNSSFPAYFSRVLDLPVSVPDPFAGHTLRDSGIRGQAPRFAVAMGLARRPR